MHYAAEIGSLLIEMDRRLKRMKKLDSESPFGRQAWGLLSLELWQRSFHDRAQEFRARLTAPSPVHGVTP